MLEMVPQFLQLDRKYFTSGGFYGEMCNKCLSITSNKEKEVLPTLESNSEESNLHIWLHCKHAYGLIYFPDTDVYHIGLPLVCKRDTPNDIYIHQHP